MNLKVNTQAVIELIDKELQKSEHYDIIDTESIYNFKLERLSLEESTVKKVEDEAVISQPILKDMICLVSPNHIDASTKYLTIVEYGEYSDAEFLAICKKRIQPMIAKLNEYIVELGNYSKERSKKIRKDFQKATPLAFSAMLDDDFIETDLYIYLELSSQNYMYFGFTRFTSKSTFNNIARKRQKICTPEYFFPTTNNFIHIHYRQMGLLIQNYVDYWLNKTYPELYSNYVNLDFNYTIHTSYGNYLEACRILNMKSKVYLSKPELKEFEVGVALKYAIFTDDSFRKAFEDKYVDMYDFVKNNYKQSFVLGVYNTFKHDLSGELRNIDFENRKLPKYTNVDSLSFLSSVIGSSFKYSYGLRHTITFDMESINRNVEFKRYKVIFRNKRTNEEVSAYKLHVINKFKPDIVSYVNYVCEFYFNEEFERINDFMFLDGEFELIYSDEIVLVYDEEDSEPVYAG